MITTDFSRYRKKIKTIIKQKGLCAIMKIRPRLLKHQGRLISDIIIDETNEFIAILRKFNIPFEELNDTYIIYGYQSASECEGK